MTFPLLSIEGASSLISWSILWLNVSQSSSCCVHLVRTSLPVDKHCSFNGLMACNAIFSWIISLGEMRPTAILEARRSRSPMVRRICSSSKRSVSWCTKHSTMSKRSFMSAGFFRGIHSQRRKARAPIGVMVRSMMSAKERPPSWRVSKISRLRRVKRSSRTQVDSSIREIEVMCPTSSCFVMSR